MPNSTAVTRPSTCGQRRYDDTGRASTSSHTWPIGFVVSTGVYTKPKWLSIENSSVTLRRRSSQSRRLGRSGLPGGGALTA